MATLLRSQEFATLGAVTFNVPAGITSVWVSMVGGGGGGSGRTANATVGGGGGGAGEYCLRVPLKVTSGGTVSGVVGAKGVGVSADYGTDGSSTTFGILKALPGKGFTSIAFPVTNGASGGGILGGTPTIPSQVGITGRYESLGFTGGCSGGGGGQDTGGTTAGAGGAAAGNVGGAAGAGTDGPGGGGAGSPWGPGGAGGVRFGDGQAAPTTSYGAGGGGSGSTRGSGAQTGGNGCAGYILVQWAG